MHTALMSLSAQGTAWLLPHPGQSYSSSLRYPGLFQLLSRRETPPAVPISSCTKGTGSGSSMAPHSVELCGGSPPSSSAPSIGKSPRQLLWAPGKRTGHSQLTTLPNPPLASSCPKKKQQSHKSPWRLQLTLSHTLLLAKMSLSAGSEPWALILAASAVPKCSG